MSVVGKVAIVSGAAQGLGKTFAERLAAEGCTVLGFDLDEQVLSAATFQGEVADVSQADDVTRVVAKARALGELGVLVNNAGNWRRTPVQSSWQQALSDWDHIMDTNLKGVLMLSRGVIPHLKASGGGYVFNISAQCVLPMKPGASHGPGLDLYNASKWALNGFTDAWAKYLAKDNIKVNGLCMGAVDTAMLHKVATDDPLVQESKQSALDSEQIAQLMMDVIDSERSGENFGAWPGEAVSIGAQPPLHKRITG